MKILNFGSLNIDYVYKLDHFVKKGETIASYSLNRYSGGKGLNQSVALGKAGLEIYHAGSIGKDGTFLLDVLKSSGVDVSLVSILENESTGHAIIQNDKEGDNCIILYGGANQSITEKQVDEVLGNFSSGDYLILQNEINCMDQIIKKAYERGMEIVLNPSPMNEKITALDLKKISWFILNEIECGQITGMETEDADILTDAMLKKFPDSRIVLTLGSEGSCYADKTRKVRQGIYKVKTVDTTAAGDTFSGYFIAGITGGKSVEESMDLAAKASAIAVSRPGAAPSVPTMREVESFRNQ